MGRVERGLDARDCFLDQPYHAFAFRQSVCSLRVFFLLLLCYVGCILSFPGDLSIKAKEIDVSLLEV